MKFVFLMVIGIVIQSGFGCDSSAKCIECVKMPGCIFIHLLEDGHTCLIQAQLPNFNLPYLYFVDMAHMCLEGSQVAEPKEDDDHGRSSAKSASDDPSTQEVLTSYWDTVMYILGSIATVGMFLKYRGQLQQVGQKILDYLRPRHVPGPVENASTQNVINDFVEIGLQKCSV